MQTLFVVLLLVLIGVVVWYDRRRERILKAATQECENIARTYWAERAAAERQRDALIDSTTRGLEQLLEAAKKREFEAAMASVGAQPLRPVAVPPHPAAAMFDAAGIYHEHHGRPRAGSEFPWGTKGIDPRAVGAGLRSDRLLSEIEAAAAHQRAVDAEWSDAHLHGVGAFRTYYDIGELPSAQHVPAAAFMGGAGGSFDGGGASGDYDRSASPASTSSASDTCSSSSSYSAPSSSDSSSSSCSSSDSGGSSSSSSD